MNSHVYPFCWNLITVVDWLPVPAAFLVTLISFRSLFYYFEKSRGITFNSWHTQNTHFTCTTFLSNLKFSFDSNWMMTQGVLIKEFSFDKSLSVLKGLFLSFTLNPFNGEHYLYTHLILMEYLCLRQLHRHHSILSN